MDLLLILHDFCLQGWKTETPVPPLPLERNRPIYYEEDPDIIPNVGFADFFEEQFSSSMNSVDGNPPSVSSHSPYYAESVTDPGDDTGSTTGSGSLHQRLSNHYPLSARSDFDGNMSNQSMAMFGGSVAGDKAASIKVVSFDEGDHSGVESDTSNTEAVDEDEEEEDDWDAELVNEQKQHSQDQDHSGPLVASDPFLIGAGAHPLDHNPFSVVNSSLPIGTNEHRKENLLEYLEGVLQASLQQQGDHSGASKMGCVPEEGSSLGGAGSSSGLGGSGSGVPGRMSSSSTLRAYFCAEETRALESANQHLKGLFSWIESSTASLKSVLCEKICSDSVNARVLLEAELHQLQRDDVYFVERLLTKCEENPHSESCVYSLEVIIRWIRGVCNIYDEVQKQQHQMQRDLVPPEVTASMMMGGTTSTAAPPPLLSEKSHRSSGSHTGTIPADLPPRGPVRTSSSNTPFNNNNNNNSAHGLSPSSSARYSPTPPGRGAEAVEEDLEGGSVREDLLRNISYEKIDSIFSRCDYILVEQGRALMGRIHENCALLEVEFNSQGSSSGTIEVPSASSSFYSQTEGFSAAEASNSRAAVRGTVARMMQLLSNQINVYRVQTHMLDIKTHVNNSNHRRVSQGFDLFATLRNLQALVDQLDTVLNSWLRMVYYFLPPAAGGGGPSSSAAGAGEAKDSEGGGGVSLAAQCFDNPGDPRIQQVRSRLMLQQTSSLGGHQYTQHHVEVLLKIVIDLQALCVANKLFVIAAVSPISLQERDIYSVAPSSSAAAQGEEGLSGPSTPVSTPPPAAPPSSTVRPKRSHYFPNLMRRKEDKQLAQEMQKAKRTSFVKKLPMYDISFEAAIGSQFISLMMLIPSPSVARAKLSFAAYCYLNRMRNDELPWQQVGRFQILDPNAVGGGSTRSRGGSTPGTSSNSSSGRENEVKTLSIDVVEAGILESFSEAFGSLDEARILQLLLYEAAVDLFPNTAPGNSSSSSGAGGGRGKSGYSAASPMRSSSSTNRRSNFRKDVFHFSLNPREGPVDPSDPSSSSSSSLKHLFSHVPFSMNLSHSILECLKDQLPLHSSSSGSSAKHLLSRGLSREMSGSSYTSSRVTSLHSKHSSWGGGGVSGGLSYSTSSDMFDNSNLHPAPSLSVKSASGGAVSSEGSFIARFVPARAKNRTLSYSLRYELYTLSYEIFSHLSKCVIDTCPSAALGLYSMCAMLLAHMHKKQERLEFHRDAAVLAVKLEKHEEAIMHGKYVMANLLQGKGGGAAGGVEWEGLSSKSSPYSSPASSADNYSAKGSPMSTSSSRGGGISFPSTSEQDINELMYVTELLASEYCENAQAELAIKTIFTTLNFINDVSPLNNPTPRSPVRSRSNSGVTSVSASSADTQSQFDRVVYPLMLRLGSIFFDMGCSMKAADTYQVLLLMLSERMDCVANDEKKVVVLSWLSECYLEMNDTETATKMLRLIKEVRRMKIDKYTTPIPLPSTLTSPNTNTSGIALDTTVKSRETRQQQQQSQSHPHVPPLHQPPTPTSVSGEEGTEAVGPTHSDREFLANNRLSPSRSMSLYNQRKLFPFSRTSSQRSSSDSHPPSPPAAPSQPRITSKKLFFADSPGMKLKYHLNCKESNLPKNCITTYNTDLGDLTSRIYFRNKQFIQALKSLTPTIIGVELMVGGKTAATAKKDSLLELGRLYYLRGKIQLEASKATTVVKFPFEVGSVQLFSAIQLISSDVKKAKTGTNQVKKQFSRGGAAGGGAGAGAPSLQSSESFHSSSAGPGISRSDSMHTSGNDSSGSGKPTFYSGTNNLLSCKRTITYANPSDLLWDAMKWFRRAWDLFHAAGDEISAAKSANYIARCHLTPSFVPSVFFQVPLDKACNLSSLVVENPADPEPLSASTATISVPHQTSGGGVTPPPAPSLVDTPRSSSLLSLGSDQPSAATGGTSPKNSPKHSSSSQFALDKQLKPLGLLQKKKRPDSLTINTDQEAGDPHNSSGASLLMRGSSISLSTKSLSSVLFAHLRTDSVDEHSAAPLSLRSHSTSSGLLQIDTASSKPRGDSVAALNGSDGEPSRTPPSPRSFKTSILLRRASLDEVQRVMQFALDTSIECCLPLLMIETYTNLAELYTLQGNKGDGTAYWIEAKELFSHLFVDGSLLPVLRRASLQYVVKLYSLYSRLVRFMWTCERSVINRNLNLLDLQLLFSSEVDRVSKKMSHMAQLSGKSLEVVLKQLTSTMAPSQQAAGGGTMTGAGGGQTERRSLSARFRTGSLRSMMGLSGLSLINIEVPPVTMQLSPVALDQYFKRHHIRRGGAAMSDRDFYLSINRDMTDRKLHDFGWRQYLDYETLLKEALMVNHRGGEATAAAAPSDLDLPSSSSSPSAARLRARSLGNPPSKRKSLARKISSFLNASAAPSEANKTDKTVSKHKSLQSMLMRKDSHSSSSMSINAGPLPPNASSSSASFREAQQVLARNVLLSLYRNHRKFDSVPRGLQKFILLKEDMTAEEEEQEEALAAAAAAAAAGVGAGGQAEEFSLTPRSLDNTLRSVDTVSSGSTLQGGAAGAGVGSEEVKSTPPAAAKKGLRRKSLTPKGTHSILNNSSSDSQESSSSHSTTTEMMSSSNSTLNLLNQTSSSNNRSSAAAGGATRGSAVFISRSALYRGNRYRPLDAHSDFEWMDESYSNYFTETLLHPTADQGETSSSLDADFFECSEGCGVDLSLTGDVTVEYVAEVEAQSESVLIQRVWRCLLVIKNAERNYQNRKHSLEVLRNTVRNALRNMSLFMLRLRAFSKQYKGRITSYDELVSKLTHEQHHSHLGGDSSAPATAAASSEPQLSEMRYIGKSDSSDVLTSTSSSAGSGSNNQHLFSSDDLSSRAVSLSHRLPHLVYTLHINNLLLLYRPHDGSRHVQLFGGNGFLVYSTVEKPPRRVNSGGRRSAERLSGSHLHSTSIIPRVASSDSSSKHHHLPAPLQSSASFMLPFVSYSGDVDDNVHGGGGAAGGMVPDALKLRGMQRLGSEDDGDSLKMTPRNSLSNRPPLVSQRSNSSVNYNNSSSGRLVSPRQSSLSVSADSPLAGSSVPLTPTNVKKITSFDGSLACSTDSFDTFAAGGGAAGERLSGSMTFKPVFGRQTSVPPRPGSGGSSSVNVLSAIAESGPPPNATTAAAPPQSTASVAVPTLASLAARSSPHKAPRRKDSLISTISFLSMGGAAGGGAGGGGGAAGGGAGISRYGSTDSLFFRSERLKSFHSTNTLTGDNRDSPLIVSGSVAFEASLSVTLSAEEVSLLFDLSVQDTSGSCGGGLTHRRGLFESMRSGVLAEALSFLKGAAGPLPQDLSGVPLTYSLSVHNSPSQDRQPTSSSEVTMSSSITAIAGGAAVPAAPRRVPSSSFPGLVPSLSWNRKSASTLNSTSTSSVPHGAYSGLSHTSNSTDTTQEVKLSPINYGGSGMSRSNTNALPNMEQLQCDSDDSVAEVFSGPDRGRAPLHCVPLTLLVSRSVSGLPWEVLLPPNSHNSSDHQQELLPPQESCVVRAASLVALCAQHFSRRSPFSVLTDKQQQQAPQGDRPLSLTPTAARQLVPSLHLPSDAGKPPLPSPKVTLVPALSLGGRGAAGAGGSALASSSSGEQLRAKGYLGPGWRQKPVFVAPCSHELGDMQLLPPDVLRAVEQHRRAKTALAGVQALLHRGDPLVNNHRSLFTAPQLNHYYSKTERTTNRSVHDAVYFFCFTHFSTSSLFPVTSPLISTGHSSPNSLKVYVSL